MKLKKASKNRRGFMGYVCMVILLSGFFVLSGGSPVADMPPESNKMAADHAPTPFSAQAIRAGCPSGRVTRYRIVVPGKADVFQVTMFKKCDPESAGFSSKTLDLNGNRVGETIQARAEWEELQGHASFPAAETTITSVKFDSPMGVLDCWLYVVNGEEDDGPEESRFWFAKTLAGPPVYFIKKVNGKVVYEMKMVENVMPKK